MATNAFCSVAADRANRPRLHGAQIAQRLPWSHGLFVTPPTTPTPGTQGKVVPSRHQREREEACAAEARIRLLLALLLLGFGSAVLAGEAERKFDFDIPPQVAHTALTEFAEQADLTLVFPDEVVREKSANALVGRYTLQEGVDILLAGTGLTPVFSNDVVLSVSAQERLTKSGTREEGTVESTTKSNLKDAHRNERRSLFARIAAALAGAVLGTAASGEEGASNREASESVIDEIIVTATYRETALMDTPIAISSLTDELLEDKGAINIQTLYQSVPSLSYRTDSTTFNTISIRGLTPIAGTSVVSVYVDEVPVTDQNDGGIRQIAGTLFDLERVEVLKGPQGTLYGEGSVGGTLRYITKDADPNAFDFKVGGNAEQISESDELSTRFNALVNIPLIQDRLGVRLSGYYRDQAGVLDIAAPRNEDDVDTQKEEGVRIKLNWYATDKLEVSLMGNYLDAAYGGPANASFPYGSTVITSDVFPNGGEDLQKQANLTVRYDLGFAEFVSASSYSEREVDFAEETGRSLVDVFFEPLVDLFFRSPFFPTFDPTLPAGPAFAAAGGTSDLFGRRSDRIVQEFRLISPSEGKWSWTTGLYHSQGRAINRKMGPKIFGFLLIPNPGFEATIPILEALLGGTSEIHVEREETSAYGEVNYAFNEAWDLTVGVRIASASTDLVHSNTDFSDTFVSPKAILGWRPTDGTLFYGTVAQGFRQGLANTDLQAAVESARQDPLGLPGVDEFIAEFGGVAETDGDIITTFEVGVKTEFWDGRISLTSAIYYMEWEDNLMGLSTFAPHTGLPVPYSANGDGAHSQGIEVELTALLTDRLTFTFGGDINDEAQIDDLDLGARLDGAGVMEGNRLPNAPKYSWNTSVSYRFPVADGWDLDARADWYRVASSFNGPTNVIKSPGYHQVNGRLTLRNADRSWRFALFAENVSDEVIVYTRNELGMRYGRPRTIGLEFAYDMGGS